MTPEMNKAFVREFYDLAFNQKKPEEAVREHVGFSYRQHNPYAGDGPEAFIAFVKEFTKANPKLHFEFKRLIAEEDLVAVHCHRTNDGSPRGHAIVDIFRLEMGKIVEHWDVVQEIPEKPANDNTMF
jgi:predicted SnoaL-like aldol condensation-catalyzing enzyme